MAYTPDNLHFIASPLNGALKLWAYDGTDASGTVAGSGYFSDATERGLELGDIVMAAEPDGTGAAFLVISDVTTGAATGTTFFTAPADGSITNAKLVNGGITLQNLAAADIADVANAINTTGKAIGKLVYDVTNNRIMIADGALAASAWISAADPSTSVTPS